VLRGPALPGDFRRAGPRWCGGWRRVNLGASHDQGQNQAESCDALNRPKDCQACVSQATGTCITQTGREIQHQACPYDCDSAVACGRYNRGSRYRNKMAEHSIPGFLAGVVRKRLGLDLVSEQTDKGRVYRINDGNAAPTSAIRVKQAA
jgi:hypothetical protein